MSRRCAWLLSTRDVGVECVKPCGGGDISFCVEYVVLVLLVPLVLSEYAWFGVADVGSYGVCGREYNRAIK